MEGNGAGARARVVLVDDEPDIVFLARTLFERDGRFDIVGEDFAIALIRGGKAHRRIPIAVDPAHIFDQDYTKLREAFISPWPVFERVKN